MSHLILTPRISEKAIGQAEAGMYVFDVPKTANKIEVKKAVEAQFKVKVETVNVMIVKGKIKRLRTKTVSLKGRESDQKKAIVKLKKGQSIALFEGAK
jgi:large subunit ribosomal protein L23